jgi:hypothetical protein
METTLGLTPEEREILTARRLIAIHPDRPTEYSNRVWALAERGFLDGPLLEAGDRENWLFVPTLAGQIATWSAPTSSPPAPPASPPER